MYSSNILYKLDKCDDTRFSERKGVCVCVLLYNKIFRVINLLINRLMWLYKCNTWEKTSDRLGNNLCTHMGRYKIYM